MLRYIDLRTILVPHIIFTLTVDKLVSDRISQKCFSLSMNKKASEQAWDHPDPLIFDLRCMNSVEIDIPQTNFYFE